MLQRYSISQLKPFSIGFDDFFNFAESFASHEIETSFPKYNIIQSSESAYSIEMALAGYSKEDISISFQDGTLTIAHNKANNVPSSSTFLHKEIATRSFTKSFTLSENVHVLDASFIDGLLNINLEKVIPEEKKLKTIHIK